MSEFYLSQIYRYTVCKSRLKIAPFLGQHLTQVDLCYALKLYFPPVNNVYFLNIPQAEEKNIKCIYYYYWTINVLYFEIIRQQNN